MSFGSWITAESFERLFWERVDIRREDECWPWRMGTNGSGYGQWSPGNRWGIGALAHRIAFFLTWDCLPEGVLDHECHNRDTSCPGGKTCLHRLCCNPRHFEVKTIGENCEAARAPRRTDDCPNGHALTPENTRWVKNREGEPTWRRCRTCQRQQMADSRARR